MTDESNTHPMTLSRAEFDEIVEAHRRRHHPTFDEAVDDLLCLAMSLPPHALESWWRQEAAPVLEQCQAMLREARVNG
jgi:hypothetical protein